MHNCHPAPHSPASLEIARPPLPTKTIFDGTKLSVDGRHPKTTTYGRKCSFQLFSMIQNRAPFRTPRRALPQIIARAGKFHRSRGKLGTRNRLVGIDDCTDATQ